MTREEAIEVIRKNWPDATFTRLREALETLIPELKESEDDNLKNKSGYYKAGKFWKASTLWNATKNKIPQRVPNMYVLQECVWNIGTLKQFANEVKNVQEVSLDYPIILDMNGNILDGAHRVVKAYLEGKDIDIVYLGDDEWPEPDYDEEKAVKKSEDEKIRKHIIEILEHLSPCHWDGNEKSECIAYLEKQKEQKPNYCHHEVDETGWTEEYRKAYYDGWNNCNMQHSQLKAEQEPATIVRIPKFRVGDIIQHVPLEKWDRSRRIASIDKDGYYFDNKHLGDNFSGGFIGFSFEKEYELVEQKPNIELIQRSWYMEGYHDRKFGQEPKWIIKTGEDGPEYELNPRYGQPVGEEQKPVDDVSKEEYVKRFKVLCDAYEIRLPNREYDIYHLCDDLSKLSIASGKQKPAEWSEEDERMLSRCVKSIECSKDFCVAETFLKAKDKEKDWLKSLPERFNLQPKQEWSEEDFECVVGELIQDVIANEKDAANYGDSKKPTSFFVKKYIDRFKSLHLQMKVELSEEDEEHLDSIIESYKELLKDYSANHGVDYIPYNTPVVARTVLNDIKFLKSFCSHPKQETYDYCTPHKEFFQWIYDRLVHVHQEDPDVDYMRSFKERIDNLSFEDKHYWKPSEEQMEAFECAERWYSDNIGHNPALYWLLCDLKKL